MTRSPIASTLLVALCTIGVPVLLTARLSSGAIQPRRSDLFLVVGVAAWLLISKAILDRGTAVPALANHRYSPRWHAHSLVDQSLIGVGFEGNKPAVQNTLGQLSAPVEDIADQLAPIRGIAVVERSREEFSDDEGGPRAIPVLHTNEPETPLILATEEHTVARRETFWSIAEACLGDGRLWASIQDLNIGREVSPGVMLAEGDELRIGWSVLIPLVASEDDEANEA